VLLTTSNTITVTRNFVFMTIGTSQGSSHSHLLFLGLTFWSWEKFFSSEKKIRMSELEDASGDSAGRKPSQSMFFWSLQS
jgi:hypothetical protein